MSQQQQTDPMRRLTLADAASVLSGATPAAAPAEQLAGDVCGTCRGAGWYYERAPGNWRDYVLRRCACRADDDAAELAERERAQRSSRLVKLAAELGALASSTLENFNARRPLPEPVTWNGHTYAPAEQRRELVAALAKARAYAAAPAGGLMLCGPYGSGKSHLAAAVANACAALLEVAYASTPAMLRYVRAGFADGSADARLEDLQRVALLVLDDIGAEQLTGWSEPLMFDLVNARTLAELPTVLTSNLHPDELPGRIASRIAGMCGAGGVVTVAACDARRFGR